MKSYSVLKKAWLKKKGVRRAYSALAPEFALAQMIIEQRIKKGLTQAALARRIGTRQSAIARLESGAYNPTVGFLKKVAKALDAQLIVSMRRTV
ncbi:helix-turn-helix transcriptional regulator [Candidatus Uhrbacteria bacterium]|nr:helix-turn-helix transcriptional regulator [Candidatus Uhrbacteria bacterium]